MSCDYCAGMKLARKRYERAARVQGTSQYESAIQDAKQFEAVITNAYRSCKCPAPRPSAVPILSPI